MFEQVNGRKDIFRVFQLGDTSHLCQCFLAEDDVGANTKSAIEEMFAWLQVGIEKVLEVFRSFRKDGFFVGIDLWSLHRGDSWIVKKRQGSLNEVRMQGEVSIDHKYKVFSHMMTKCVIEIAGFEDSVILPCDIANAQLSRKCLCCWLSPAIQEVNLLFAY